VNISKRVFVTKVLLIFLLVLLVNRAVFSFWLVRQMLGAQPIVISVGLRQLFIPLVSVVLFSILWGFLRLEYILFVIGLVLTFGVLYEPLSVPMQALEVLQAVGLLLILIAVIRIVIFLLSKQSAKVVEASIEKWMAKKS
jgi:hypothetical protein